MSRQQIRSGSKWKGVDEHDVRSREVERARFGGGACDCTLWICHFLVLRRDSNTNTLEQVRGDLALRAQVEEVVNKLKHALETLNPEELSLSNDQAQELDLENHSKFGDIAKRARKKQKKVEFADKAVRAALRPPLDVDTLRDAINASMSCKYGDEVSR